MDGHIELPTKSGLGLEFDEKEVEKKCVYREELGDEFYYPSHGRLVGTDLIE